MKNPVIIYALLFLLIPACSDSDSDPEVSLEDKIIDAKWTGEYRYNSDLNTTFSVSFKKGDSLSWYELNRLITGTWSLESNAIEVKLENGSSFKASVKEGEFGDFITNDNAFEMDNLRKSEEVSLDKLRNTTWTGTMQNTTEPVTLEFDDGLSADISFNIGIFFDPLNCVVYGNGVLLTEDLSNDPVVYIVFQDKLLIGTGYQNKTTSFTAKKDE
jgi:hypothetical protein